MVDRPNTSGLCPSCHRGGRVGHACEHGACAREGLHFIPEDAAERDRRHRDPLVGRVVGRHLLVEALRRAGIDTAYRALQLPALLEVELALALPDREQEAHHNLFRQAVALGRLGGHPNITRLVLFGADPLGTFLAFESQHGARTLDELIAAHGDEPVAPSAAYLLLAPLGAALGALAAIELVHGEIRPENVFVHEPPGYPAFVQLGGFVRVPPPEPPLQFPTHELVWRAPEQIVRHTVNATTDAYSVAAIAFLLVFGRVPFPSDDREQLYWAKQHPAWDPTAQVAGLAPDEVLAFFRKALAFDPAQRYRGDSLWAELEVALGQLEVGAEGPAPQAPMTIEEHREPQREPAAIRRAAPRTEPEPAPRRAAARPEPEPTPRVTTQGPLPIFEAPEQSDTGSSKPWPRRTHTADEPPRRAPDPDEEAAGRAHVEPAGASHRVHDAPVLEDQPSSKPWPRHTHAEPEVARPQVKPRRTLDDDEEAEVASEAKAHHGGTAVIEAFDEGEDGGRRPPRMHQDGRPKR